MKREKNPTNAKQNNTNKLRAKIYTTVSPKPSGRAHQSGGSLFIIIGIDLSGVCTTRGAIMQHRAAQPALRGRIPANSCASEAGEAENSQKKI